MEIVLTALLVSVILGTASAAQNVGAIAALGVGGYIALAGLWAAPVSGVSMNTISVRVRPDGELVQRMTYCLEDRYRGLVRLGA